MEHKDSTELLARMHTRDHLFDNIATMVIGCERTLY